jgi:polyether ionophore transport system permease protein
MSATRGATRAIARRALGDSRTRTLSFAALFFLGAVTQATAYREGYPTLEDRIRFARSVGENDAARLLYGVPHDLLTVGGYVSWRAGGSLAAFAAIWALLGAVRAMRADEESGRADFVFAGAVGRGAVFGAQVVAIGAGAVVLWLALWLALLAGKLPAGGSAYLALAVVSVVPVFAGVGAVASQLAPAKRMATGIASGVLVVAFSLRVVADIGGVGWLRWASPLGWAEQMRPFADPQPLVVALPLATGALLLWLAAELNARRDIGAGLIPARDRAAPRLRLLGSPPGHALRSERGTLIAWLVGIGGFAFLMGVISDAATPDVISKDVQRQLEKLGTGSVVTPAGWLGFTFVFFMLAVSLLCCMEVAAIRREEAEQRLETLLAQPLGRPAWLGGRLALAVGGAIAAALAAGLLAWAGAQTQGADVSLGSMIGAGANTLPPALLFLALGALAFAAIPRASGAIAYGLVGLAFAWELFGSLLEVPDWLLALSPFHDVGLVPGEPFDAVGATVMLALAAAATAASIGLFRRRDLAAG